MAERVAECDESYHSWTVEQLKVFLRERRVPLSGNKKDLVKKVTDIVYTDRLEEDIEAQPFQNTKFSPPPSFDKLPTDGWVDDDLPQVTETSVTTYLKARSGYTKNLHTGCQCAFKLEMAKSGTTTYIKAKCRPTMRKDPAFYSLFVVVDDGKPTVANCKCPAGET